MDSLVSTEWLEGELGSPDLQLIDATAFLPGSGRDARAEFGRAHIPGAAFLDIEEVSDTDSPFPHMMPGVARLMGPCISPTSKKPMAAASYRGLKLRTSRSAAKGPV